MRWSFVGVVALILFALHKESNYYKYTEAVGEIEQKYTAFGDKEVSCQEYDANDDVIGKYAVWYPSELESSNTQYPVVIFANGTGSTLSTYKPFLTHLSSWGFISVGNDDENTRTGASLEETIKFPEFAENEKKDSIFYQQNRLRQYWDCGTLSRWTGGVQHGHQSGTRIYG